MFLHCILTIHIWAHTRLSTQFYLTRLPHVTRDSCQNNGRKTMIRMDWFDGLYKTLHKSSFGEINWELWVEKKKVQVTQRKSSYDRKKNFRWPKKDSGGWKEQKFRWPKKKLMWPKKKGSGTEENRSGDWKLKGTKVKVTERKVRMNWLFGNLGLAITPLQAWRCPRNLPSLLGRRPIFYFAFMYNNQQLLFLSAFQIRIKIPDKYWFEQIRLKGLEQS